MKKTIWDVIDRPIKPLIFQLARIGMFPKFSCCGFNYKDEEERKTHGREAFIVFKSPIVFDETQGQRIAAFFAASRIFIDHGWRFQAYQGKEWRASFYPDEHKFYNCSDGVHHYESTLISIQRLVGAFMTIETVTDEFTITDGNDGYAELTNDEWQIQPLKSVTFKDSDWDKLFPKWPNFNKVPERKKDEKPSD